VPDIVGTITGPCNMQKLKIVLFKVFRQGNLNFDLTGKKIMNENK
jgi:hypothetical protein